MMRFSTQADMAIRMLLYLDSQTRDRNVPSRELSAALDAGRSTLTNMLPRFVRAGIIGSKAGKHDGGIKLVKPLEEILLSEVITLADQGSGWKFAACDYDSGCKCYLNGECAVQPMYNYVTNEVVKVFDRFKMSEFQRPLAAKKAVAFARQFQDKLSSGADE